MKIVTIEISVPCVDSQNTQELVEKFAEILEEGLQESSFYYGTAAEGIGCDGNTLSFAADGEVIVEVCL